MKSTLVKLFILSLLILGCGNEGSNNGSIYTEQTQKAQEVVNVYDFADTMVTNRLYNEFDCEATAVNCLNIQAMLQPCDVVQGAVSSIGGINCPLQYNSTVVSGGMTMETSINDSSLITLFGLRAYNGTMSFAFSGDDNTSSEIHFEQFVQFNTVKYGWVELGFNGDTKKVADIEDSAISLKLSYPNGEIYTARRNAKERDLGNNQFEILFEECFINNSKVDCQELEGTNKVIEGSKERILRRIN